MPLAGQLKNCLLEPLTDKNSWLEVKLKRAGQQAAWEKLEGAAVPEPLLAAFVQEKRKTKAIPLPGVCVLLAGPHDAPTLPSHLTPQPWDAIACSFCATEAQN